MIMFRRETSLRLKEIGIAALGILSFLLVSLASTAAESQRISLIRDAEIEDLIRDWSRPIFQAAGLQPNNIEIYLVKDRSLNAFVAGGQRMFLHTGFLQATTNPGQVIGVIAHETGHISGGHLSRVQGALANARTPALIGILLGVGAAIAGEGELAGALMSGGQSIGVRNFLSYSRTQEGAADQSAVRFLTATEQSAMGLVEFLQTIEDQELLVAARQDPYMRSHPVTRERIDNLLNQINKSPYADKPWSPDDVARHQRMVAKLDGFINPIGRTLRDYQKRPDSIAKRYALAIAHYRRPDIKTALNIMDGLIEEYPQDPYFWELRGQMLREHGRVQEALGDYQRSVDLNPDSALLRGYLAQVQLDNNQTELLDPAIENLNFALSREPDQSFHWRLLAIAWGRKGDEGMASIALGEEAILKNRNKDAVFYANRALRTLPPDHPRRLQAEDIINQAQTEIDLRALQE